MSPLKKTKHLVLVWWKQISNPTPRFPPPFF
jgi:hypothetical protein